MPQNHTKQQPTLTDLLFPERYISFKNSARGYGASKTQTQVNISLILSWLSENNHDWFVDKGKFWNFDVLRDVFEANNLHSFTKDQKK